MRYLSLNMRYLHAILFFMMTIILGAQTPTTFTRHLQQSGEGMGSVVLLQDEEITRLVDNAPLPVKTESTSGKTTHSSTTKSKSSHAETADASAKSSDASAGKYSGARVRHKARGYRIEVYAGTGSSAAKRQAKLMESRVRKAFPELSIYCHFKSPRWVCRVGDFATREEAERYLTLIRKQKISPEASIVPDTVLLVE